MSTPFHNLSSPLQRTIDEAFDLVVKSTSPHDETSFVGGGFIIDESPEDHIPLSSVPQALSYLNLSPDDEQVLAVFRNAASGWSSATTIVDMQHLSGVVSRDDWRSVCAVLLEQLGDSERQEENDDTSAKNSMDADSSENGDDDEYRSPESDEDAGDNSEYEEPSEKSLHGRKQPGSSRHSSKQHALSMKQRDACLEAYSLFFPGASLEDVSTQRITVKEIQQAAATLGEKLTRAQINEMLETFSSSPDKSMTFSDFSRLMTVTKLI